MMPFISFSLMYRRRVTLAFVLLSALAFTFLAIDLRKSYDETAARGYQVFDKVRNFGAGQIPDAFRPSTYLGTSIKEPTTREEWESFEANVEGGGTDSTRRSAWEDVKKWMGNLVHRVSDIPALLHGGHVTRYDTDWDDLPPNIKAFKEWEFARGMVYQGTGERMKRFLEKARSGKGVVVSVVGGSVSKGRGLPVNEELLSPHSMPSSHNHDQRSLAEDWHIDHRHAVSQNLYNPLNVHYQIFDFINRTFPAIPQTPGDEERGYRGENVFINGAQGGVGSDYFAGCWKEHIPEDSDLVLVDLGINDIRDLSSMENYELLLRSILEMDSQPAVLNLQPFSLLFSTLSSASSLHIDVAAYYDTPVISIRDIVLPRILNDGTRRTSPGGGAGVGLEIVKWFRNVPEEELVKGDAKNVYVAEADSWVDLMHISRHGHTLLAEMAIHYLQMQIQLLSSFDVHSAENDPIDAVAGTSLVVELDSNDTAEYQETPPKPVLTDIPGMLLASHYTSHKPLRRSNPSCRSTNSAFKQDRFRVNSGGVESHGPWYEYAWGEKRYLVTRQPGSRISVPFNVTAPAFYGSAHPSKPSSTKDKASHLGQGQGYVKIGHLRSNVLGLGSLECWAEQDAATGSESMTDHFRHKGTKEFPTRVDGWWESKERNQGVLTTIAEDLMPGSYTLHCTLLEQTLDPGGGTEFRLIAVVYD